MLYNKSAKSTFHKLHKMLQLVVRQIHNKAITSPTLCTPVTPFLPTGDAAYRQRVGGGPSHGISIAMRASVCLSVGRVTTRSNGVWALDVIKTDWWYRWQSGQLWQQRCSVSRRLRQSRVASWNRELTAALQYRWWSNSTHSCTPTYVTRTDILSARV